MPLRDNAGSWQGMISFYEKIIGWQGQRYLPLLDLVKTIADSDDALKFRAGQSLESLIVSTTSYHGLEQHDPHIVVYADRKTDLFVIEYWCGQNKDDMVESRTCQSNELLTTISPLMQRLWQDTLGKNDALRI